MAVDPQPHQPQRSSSGILPSNVGPTQESAPPPKRAGFPVALLLLPLGIVVGAAAVLLLTSNRPVPPQPQAAGATPAATSRPGGQSLVPTVAVTARKPAAATGPLAPVNGISCDALESTIFHIHIHLAVFINGQEVQIPFGIGIGQPWQVSDSSVGPFVEDGSCFYWMHTHTEDGVIHIESPIRRTFTLGDFFAIWQEPLSAQQVGPGTGDVIVYVNGQRDSTNPADIRLTSHQRIQLDVGADVPPYSFDFRPGD
jgi:hypothetical protein